MSINLHLEKRTNLMDIYIYEVHLISIISRELNFVKRTHIPNNWYMS